MYFVDRGGGRLNPGEDMSQVSSVQEALSILDAMVLQRKSKISLLELLESYVGGTVPKVVIQTKPPTPRLA